MRELVVALAGSVVLLGCGSENSPIMRPGEDCLSCHSVGGRARSLPWSAAGTIYATADADPQTGGVMGVHVLLTDALGKKVSLVTNQVGNFYTAETMTPPIAAEIDQGGATIPMMRQPVPDDVYGPNSGMQGVGCNGCHTQPSFGGAQGRINLEPGQ
jgi:hypothetical protein